MDAGSTSPGNLPVAHPGRADSLDHLSINRNNCKMRARVTLPIHSNTLPISSNLSLPEDCPNLDALCNAGLPKSTSVGILKKPHSFILVLNCRLATRLTRKGSVMKQASEHQLSLPPVDSGNKIHVKLLLTCGKDNTRRYLRWTVEM